MKIRSILAGILASTPFAAAAATPEIGVPAPAFEFRGVDAKVYRDADYVGKRGVVIAWFPKAFTPG